VNDRCTHLVLVCGKEHISLMKKTHVKNHTCEIVTSACESHVVSHAVVQISHLNHM
jgi:hypothetical protein